MFELHRYWWDLHLSGIFIVYKIFPISCSVCFSNWTMGRHLRPGTGANIHKSYSRTRPPPTQHHHCCWAAVAVVVVTTLYSWILIPALEITSLLNWWHCVRRWLGLWVANSEAQTSDQQKTNWNQIIKHIFKIKYRKFYIKTNFWLYWDA